MAQSNDKIYELINSVRRELKQDIGKIDTKLDDLAEKRIKPIEDDVTNLKIDSATGNVKIGILSFIGATIASSIIGIVVLRWFK